MRRLINYKQERTSDCPITTFPGKGGHTFTETPWTGPASLDYLLVHFAYRYYRHSDYRYMVYVFRFLSSFGETVTMRSSVATYVFLNAILANCLIAAVNADSPLLKSWTLYHSVDGGNDFVRRGQIRLGVAAVDGDVTSSTEGTPELTIEHDENENLTTESIHHLIGSGLYQLKLVEDGNEANVVMTSVPACHLRRANFRYVLVLFNIDGKVDWFLRTYGQLKFEA